MLVSGRWGQQAGFAIYRGLSRRMQEPVSTGFSTASRTGIVQPVPDEDQGCDRVEGDTLSADLSRVGLEFISVSPEQLQQPGMDEELFLAEGHLAQHAEVGQVMQVAGRCLTLGDAFFHQVADATVRLLEDHIDQFSGVDPGQPRSNMLGGMVGKLADRGDLASSPSGGFGHGLQSSRGC